MLSHTALFIFKAFDGHLLISPGLHSVYSTMLDDGPNSKEVFKNIQVTVTHLQAPLASVAVGDREKISQTLVLNPRYLKCEVAITTFHCLVSLKKTSPNPSPVLRGLQVFKNTVSPHSRAIYTHYITLYWER